MATAVANDLGEAIAALAADLEWLDGCGLADRLQEIERCQRRLERAMVAVVHEADRRGVWAQDGHRNVRGWCMAATNWSYGEAAHRVRSVALLDDLRGVDEALATGEVGVAQVRELARARANPRCGDELAEFEAVLLAQARSLPFEDFRRCVHRWETLADADGAHRDHEQTHGRAPCVVRSGRERLLAQRSRRRGPGHLDA